MYQLFKSEQPICQTERKYLLTFTDIFFKISYYWQQIQFVKEYNLSCREQIMKEDFDNIGNFLQKRQRKINNISTLTCVFIFIETSVKLFFEI